MPKDKTENLKETTDAQEISVEESFSNDQPDSVDTVEITEDTNVKDLLAEKEDKYLRLAAEFENYKKRIARQHDDLIHGAESGVLRDLLEVIDNFKRAITAADDKKDFEAFKEGISMISEQMKKILDHHDVIQIETVGKSFNPDLHEAVMQIETDDHPEGVVTQELSGGYKKGDRVIRHAKVGVSSGKKTEDKKDEDN